MGRPVDAIRQRILTRFHESYSTMEWFITWMMDDSMSHATVDRLGTMLNEWGQNRLALLRKKPRRKFP
jgi:hypothetical protein